MSIDKNTLVAVLKMHIEHPALINLAGLIIRHDCTKDFVFKGNKGLLDKIPPHKTLLHAPPDKGLPIGNLTSQFFANVYLNELDQYVKHTLKVRHYLRYVDDLVLLHETPGQLFEWKGALEAFLREKLQMQFKETFTLRRVSEGADFLGYIIRPGYTLVRRRVVGNLKEKLRTLGERCERTPPLPSRERAGVRGQLRGGFIARFNNRDIASLRQVVASYMGHFRHANAHKLAHRIFEKHGFLSEAFTLARGFLLQPRFEPSFMPATLEEQVAWFKRAYPGMIVFTQVGRFFEVYGADAEKAGAALGIHVRDGGRGLGKQCGFPVSCSAAVKKRARVCKLPYIIIGEQGYYRSGLKKRLLTEKFEIVPKTN